jgi:YesN/AraC family two-component response regulator
MAINEDTVITSLEKIIEDTPTKDLNVLSVKTLAQRLGLSKNIISQYFKRKRNFKLSRLIKYKKIQKGYYLLKNNSELSVEKISITVGYEKTEYFSELIKKTYGKAPSEIKNEVKKIKCHFFGG